VTGVTIDDDAPNTEAILESISGRITSPGEEKFSTRNSVKSEDGKLRFVVATFALVAIGDRVDASTAKSDRFRLEFRPASIM
jgi:hypothetical protein